MHDRFGHEYYRITSEKSDIVQKISTNVRFKTLLSVSHANEMGFGSFFPDFFFPKMLRQDQSWDHSAPGNHILYIKLYYFKATILINQFRKTQLLWECLRWSTKQSSAKRSAALSKNPLICCTRNGHLKAHWMWWEKDIYIYVFLTPKINEPERRMSLLLLCPRLEGSECCEALAHVQCFKEWQGGGDWLILQKKRKLLSNWRGKLLFMSLLLLFFAVFLMRVFFFTCCVLMLLLALGFCSFWNWNEVNTFMTINSLQQIFFAAVSLAHFTFFRLK